MRIFNRKKKEEEKNEIEELKNLTIKQNNTLDEIISKQEEINKEHKKNTEKLLNRIDEQDTNIKTLETKITTVQEKNTKLQKIVEIQNDVITGLQDKFEKETLQPKEEEVVEKVEEPVEEDNEETNNHIYKITGKSAKVPYQKATLKGEYVSSNSRLFSFTIKDVIDIKENLQKYHDEGLSPTQIAEKYGLNHQTTYRLIWHIEEGFFDELIQEYLEKPKDEKEHIRILGDTYCIPYGAVTLKKDRVYNKNNLIPYTVHEIKELKERIPNIKEYTSFKSLFTGMEFKDYTGKILIWNIEEGNLDDVLNEYDNTHTHIRQVPESMKKPQRHLKMLDDGKLISNGHTLKYDIHTIMTLKEKIPNTKQYPTVKSMMGPFNISYMTVCSLVWNIEEGYYDEIIKEYEENKDKYSPQGTLEKFDEKRHHIYQLSPSYQVPLRNLTVDSEGYIHNKINQKLPYTIYDIIEMKKRIYSSKKTNISMIYDDFSFTSQLGNKLVWNIEEGYFDDLIDEWNSRNYTYERRNNILYIDGEDTHLTIEKCNIIVDCLVNDTNKPQAINRLIKTYPQTSPKYIRIIGEEYNNPNLSKVLLKKVEKVEKVMVNNPQKRKEQGLSL